MKIFHLCRKICKENIIILQHVWREIEKAQSHGHGYFFGLKRVAQETCEKISPTICWTLVNAQI